MITDFNSFENNPEVGDYVYCVSKLSSNNIKRNKFIKDKIGQIVSISEDKNYPYIVHYDNIPDNFSEFRMQYDLITKKSGKTDNFQFGKWEIELWNKNINDLETMINAKKFNI